MVSIAPQPCDETSEAHRNHPYFDSDDAPGYCRVCWLPPTNWRHNDEHVTASEALALCVSDDAAVAAAGRLCTKVLDRHTRRPDDGRCDACGVFWPCPMVLAVVDLIREAR